MKFVQKSLAGLGGILLAAILIATLAPKTARGVVTTLVQVANTSANPVPNRDVDNGPRQAVTLIAFSHSVKDEQFREMNGVDVYNVPAGKRLVAEFISGNFTTPTGAHIANAFIFGSRSGGQYQDYLSPNLVTTGNFNVYQLAQPMRAYYDAGTVLEVDVELTSGGFASDGGFTLRGYLVDCTDACS